MPTNSNWERLIEIKVWSENLLIILIPISVIAIGSFFYTFYKIGMHNNFSISFIDVLIAIYQDNEQIQNLSWFIIPTVLCFALNRWTSSKLKE